MICTITPIVNRQQAASYYSRDDYYSKNARKEDYWQGSLAKFLSLDGTPVDKKHIEEFINFVSQRDNIGDGKSPTLACDITFSVPKSVSLLQAISPKYRDIVNKCLEETTNEMIELIQEKYIRTRRGKGGRTFEYTHNFIAAGINHEVNRNDELDRHVHLFIPNLTQTKDGKILTIDIRYLMKQQKLFGAISRSKLASKLQREGIKIEVDDPQHGFYHVKGINRDIEEKFSTRCAEILAEKEKRGAESAFDIQSIILKTRKAKNHKINIDKVFTDTSDFLHSSNINVQIHYEIKSIDKKHQKTIFDSVLKDMEFKNFSLSREDIIQNVLNAGLELQMQLEDVNKLINQSKRLRKAIDKNGNEIFISKANEKCEQDLLELLKQCKGNGTHIDSLDADKLLHKVVTEKNLTPNEEQVNAILTCITSKNSYVAVQGLAGVGKTYFVNIMREMCDRSNIKIKGAAFAGAAADELANDSGIVDCNTIDSLLLRYENESLKKQGKPTISDFNFSLKRDYNFKGLKKDVDGGFLVVDEFGMVDDIHARALMQLCQAKGWKLIAIGDYDQIPSINVGDPHRLLINHGATTCYLQNITRQRDNQELLKIVKESVLDSVDNAFRLLNNSTISKAADKIISSIKSHSNIFIKADSEKMADEINSEVHKRIGNADNKNFASNDEKVIDEAEKHGISIEEIHSGIREIKDNEQRQISTIEEYFEAMKKYAQDKIAVATLSNAERIALNEKIHKRLVEQNFLPVGKFFHVTNGDVNKPQEHDINLSIGERIICLKNDKNLGVRNGTKGNIINISDKNITLKTDSGKVVTFNSEQYNTFDLGYVMTLNKLQGATVQKIICNADSKSHMDRNKFYVAVSRAKSDVTILTDDIDKLHKNAQEWCHKVTSDDFIHNLEDEIEENQTKTVGSDYKDKFQRAIDLKQLAELSPVAIAERNKIREKYGEVTWDKLSSFSSAFDSLRFDSSTQDKPIQKETAIRTPSPVQNQPVKIAPMPVGVPQSNSVETSSTQSPIKPKKAKKIEKSHCSGFSR